MSTDDYSVYLIRLLRGEESLAAAFWVTLMILLAYFAYEMFVPTLSNVYDWLFEFLRVAFIGYAAVTIHNSCGAAGTIPRYAARAYVLLLIAAGAYFSLLAYGEWGAIAYPFVIMFTVYMVRL